MSNFLAIAAVTATLGQTLQPAVGADVPGAVVRTTRPDGGPGTTPGPAVNLFLYQVTPSGAWRSADTPTRAPDGHLVQRPRIALDLHYLLSCYGNESQLEPQRLLGSVVRTLNAQPVLSPSTIRATVASPSLPFLAASDLAEEVERVRFTLMPLSLEELSKLWSIFFQTPYALSVAYQASVVFVEGPEAPQPIRPVAERAIQILPSLLPAAGPPTRSSASPAAPGLPAPGAPSPGSPSPG